MPRQVSSTGELVLTFCLAALRAFGDLGRGGRFLSSRQTIGGQEERGVGFVYPIVDIYSAETVATIAFETEHWGGRAVGNRLRSQPALNLAWCRAPVVLLGVRSKLLTSRWVLLCIPACRPQFCSLHPSKRVAQDCICFKSLRHGFHPVMLDQLAHGKVLIGPIFSGQQR